MKKIMIVLSIVCFGVLVAHEFVVEAPVKKQSVSQLKESIGRHQAKVLEQCSEVIQELAHMQQVVIADVQSLLEQDKATIFGSKNCEKLERYQSVLDSLSSACDRMHHHYRQAMNNRETVVA